jgi:hypothetical protein
MRTISLVGYVVMKIKPASVDGGSNPAEGKQTAGPAPSGQHLKKLLLALSAVVVSLLAAEIGLRTFFAQRLEVVQDERNLMCRYDSMLGWFPIANSSNHFCASRDITVVHNSEGFRGSEYFISTKPKIIFLGDSYVWGYDVQTSERFTDKLQARHPEWTIYNFGVSGYGTDQEYILLEKRFDFYKPQVVFLMFSTETDGFDNSHNCLFGYYKPYCTAEPRLELQGTPVPRSERVFFAEHQLLARCYVIRLLAIACYKLTGPGTIEVIPNPTAAIIRDMQRYAKIKGAIFVVGVTEHNPPLEDFLGQCKIPFVDVSNPLRYVGFGGHWTPEGHTFVADKVERFLLQGKFMEQSPATPNAEGPHQPGGLN